MEAVLPRGRIRVTGVIENVAWRERHEAQKRARAARVEDPAKKARIEARQQAKEARKAEREARKQARIQERIRTQMLRETYKQLGIEEGYIGNKQSQIDAARANNPNAPAKPNSSPNIVNIKSVCFSGKKACCDCVPAI